MDRKAKSPSSLTEQSTDSVRPSKIQRMSNSPLSGKICLICYCAPDVEKGHYPDDMRSVNYSLYLFDLDAERRGNVPYRPRYADLYFDIFDLGLYGVCLLGSTLYLFGEKREVFSYDLTKIPPTPTTLPSSSSLLPSQFNVLTKDWLCSATATNFPKCRPVGCQTPNGKLLVFSRVLHHIEYNVDFELFEPGKEAWTMLPDLNTVLENCWEEKSSDFLGYVSVRSYSFIDNGDVLLVATEIGNFTLDVENYESGWSRYRDFEFPLEDFGHPLLVRDGLCFTSCFAYVIGDDGPNDELFYPGLSSDYYMRRGGVTWLSSDSFCDARILVDKSTCTPLLTLDLCEFNLGDFQSNKDNPCRQEDGEIVLPGVKSREKFDFILGPQSHFVPDHFFLMCLSFIPTWVWPS